MVWKNNADISIKDHLEKQVEGTLKHRDAYKNAKDPSKAQLWCAVANLSKEVFELNMKLKLLEQAMRDMGQGAKHIKPVPTKEESQDLLKIAANPKNSKKTAKKKK